MLSDLRIKDFAIIEGLSISFGPGLNIFTGETGAGKSIIMDAIALILGDRASADIIRGGCDEATVEAAFDSSLIDGVDEILEASGIESGDELIIKRVIQRAGRNRIFINGSFATLTILSEIGSKLIDVYGQSAHLSLARSEEQIEILDSFSGASHLRENMGKAWKEFSGLRREYETLLSASTDSVERRDFLSFQLKEITDVSPREGEDEELKRERDRLQNSEKIKAATGEAERAIYSDNGSIVERLGVIIKALNELSSFDDRIGKTAKTIEESLYTLEDAGRTLGQYCEEVEADPETLEAMAARLDAITRLKRKHGGAISEVLEKKAEIEEELSGLEDFEGRLNKLSAAIETSRAKALEAAKALTEARKKAAKGLQSGIEAELKDLGMKGALFEVGIETGDDFGEKGADRITFLIAPNPGEEKKPLARIASGGELSRIMLAIKRVSAAGKVPTLVFDEIDTGVGGAIAQAMGLKLKEVCAAHQVICITHMPQIAAFADRHFGVSKGAAGGRTVTSVRQLDDDGRVTELSQMLGGMKVTDVTVNHASELIQAAKALSAGANGSKKKGRKGVVKEVIT